MGTTNVSLLFVWVFVSFSLLQTPILAVKKSYVVYLGGHSHGSTATSADYKRVTDSHYELLGSYLGSKEKAQDAIFYSYHRSLNGFAANLEEEEAMQLSKDPNIISITLNKARKLHTTRSWEFMGLERDGRVPVQSIWSKARFGEDVIIGNLDTGVWPEAESFSDEGMGPIPSKWKGICQRDQNNTKDTVQCNRMPTEVAKLVYIAPRMLPKVAKFWKLIGVRYFYKGFEALTGKLNVTASARDTDGHGTHTLSTAAGRFVSGANIRGYANGTAKGGSPNARVAAYKVCWPPISDIQCSDADILAGFDAAIADGVDVLSVSLGGDPADYFEDGIAIASFHAVKNGITVVCSAGNSGPSPASVSNVAPWILTVGASTIDRQFPSLVELGNKKRYTGQSISADYLSKKLYPLISSANAPSPNSSADISQLCIQGSLDPEKVKGKIVVCLRGSNGRVEKGEVVSAAGGVGMVLANDQSTSDEIISDAHVLPATHITYSGGVEVFSYINSTQSPVGYITRPTTFLGAKPAPVMAAFSSIGPNIVTGEILKPDITAPGVNILAAYTQATSPSGQPSDPLPVRFYLESGTSMSCPHVAGIVGLLKTMHPDWSPSAIRSAIMTTARTRDNLKQGITESDTKKATPFDYGAGHVRPNRAMDPGLVYDLTVKDYLNFLCGIEYDSTQLLPFTNGSYKCPSNSSLLDFNYPSITITRLTAAPVTTSRTVKNVGTPGTYTARVHPPAGVSVAVEPNTLTFTKMGEEKTFKVTFSLKNGTLGDYVFGRLIWSDGLHYVRSPIVVS